MQLHFCRQTGSINRILEPMIRRVIMRGVACKSRNSEKECTVLRHPCASDCEILDNLQRISTFGKRDILNGRKAFPNLAIETHAGGLKL